MRQIFLETALPSWLKVCSGVLALPSSSKAGECYSCFDLTPLVTTKFCSVTRYGVGYHLTLVKDIFCVSSRVEQIVKSFVPEAEQVTDVGAELSFILPSSSTPSFPNLFDKIEANKADLGIQSFGVSITTMEEVFMKVGEGTDETLDDR